jgi:hypothetical protein
VLPRRLEVCLWGAELLPRAAWRHCDGGKGALGWCWWSDLFHAATMGCPPACATHRNVTFFYAALGLAKTLKAERPSECCAIKAADSTIARLDFSGTTPRGVGTLTSDSPKPGKWPS